MCTECETPNDNRFELIKAAKKRLIEATNIESSPDEMKVLDNILFRMWQMGWLPESKVKESTRDVLLEMRDSPDEAVRNFAKRISYSLARDNYCNLCGRILRDDVRNCDYYKNEKEARNAFERIYFGPIETEFVDMAFISWLFERFERKN